MKLFPYSLVRIGGESFEDWAQLRTDKTDKLLQDLEQKNARREQLKEELCEELMEFIRSLEDQNAQNAVQNVRRDLFNNRKLKNSKVNRAKEHLSAELSNKLDTYLQLLEDIKQITASGEQLYTDTLHENRTVFKELLEKDTLKRGLVLSSQSLLERLNSYVKRPLENFRKKEAQTEISLLQYLTRMYAKTSPFSTFTNLATMTPDQDTKGISLTHEKGKEKIKGHIRLNNYLLKFLTDLFIAYEPVYTKLPVRINPTIQQEGENYLYLTNNNNIEAFQRIPQNPVVEYIYELVSAEQEGLPFNDLLDQLLEAIDADRAEIADYIKQLLDYGFLEYHLGVSGIDPDWDTSLIAVLEKMKEVPHVQQLIDALREMRNLSEEYANKPSGERGEVLKKAYDIFREACMKLHEAAGLPEDERKTREELDAIRKQKAEEAKAEEEKKKKEAEEAGEKAEKEEEKEEEKPEEKEEEVFKRISSTYFSYKPEQIFYEDTTREIEGKISREQAESVIGSLFDILSEIRVYQGTGGERENMKKYFLDKYGENQSVELLKYYEDYFREFKKPQKEEENKLKEERAKAEKEGKPLKEPEAKAPEKDPKKEKFEQYIIDKTDFSGEELHLKSEWLKEANREAGVEPKEKRPASYGTFIQLMENNGEVTAYVNSSFSGYGKMFSRFLHIVDPEVTKTTREWNKSLILEDEMYVENCDASYFNANLHPPLMPKEIWMPGGHNSLPAEHQIPILDFKIKLGSKEDNLELVHEKSGKRSHVFDLGFQGHQGRSQLFQLLDKFTKADYLYIHPLVMALNMEYGRQHYRKNTTPEEEQQQADKKPEPRITFNPRVYVDKLIFQRKTWQIPVSLLPEKQPQDTPYDYFREVNLWRLENNMPDEVFVYVDQSRGQNLKPEQAKRLTRDDYKPQYINFRQPMLVNLFEKLATKTPASMKIVEMLPASENMLKIDGKRHVTEMVMQWYNQ